MEKHTYTRRLCQGEVAECDGHVIVGYGVYPDGDVEAWIATIPEPSTLILLSIGAAGLLLYGWRRRV